MRWVEKEEEAPQSEWERRRAVERFMEIPHEKRVGLLVWHAPGGGGNLRDYVVTGSKKGLYKLRSKGEAKEVSARPHELHLSEERWKKAKDEIEEAQKKKITQQSSVAAKNSVVNWLWSDAESETLMSSVRREAGSKWTLICPSDNFWKKLAKQWERLGQENGFTGKRSSHALYNKHYSLVARRGKTKSK